MTTRIKSEERTCAFGGLRGEERKQTKKICKSAAFIGWRELGAYTESVRLLSSERTPAVPFFPYEQERRYQKDEKEAAFPPTYTAIEMTRLTACQRRPDAAPTDKRRQVGPSPSSLPLHLPPCTTGTPGLFCGLVVWSFILSILPAFSPSSSPSHHFFSSNASLYFPWLEARVGLLSRPPKKGLAHCTKNFGPRLALRERIKKNYRSRSFRQFCTVFARLRRRSY